VLSLPREKRLKAGLAKLVAGYIQVYRQKYLIQFEAQQGII
jgi:hypothetical protein